MSVNSGKFFSHGKKVWRPPVVSDLDPVINIVTNPRNKILPKTKYDLKVNDIKMSDERNVSASTRAEVSSCKVGWYKVTESKEFCEKSDFEFKSAGSDDVEGIKNTIIIKCINRSTRSEIEEQAQTLKISRKEKLGRKVYLKWSKYSYSSSSSDGMNNASTKPLRISSYIRDKYLMRKYTQLWKNFVTRNAISKIKPGFQKMSGENSLEKLSVKPANNKREINLARNNPEDNQIVKTTNNNNKSQSSLQQKYHENRKKFEKSVLESQKQKIREQALMIEELQLARLKLEEEKFARETRDLLVETKCKNGAKVRCKSGPAVTSQIRKADVSKFKDSWEFVTRMEARACERRKRWDSIKQRKDALEAERIERIKLEEELRRKLEEEEKKEKLLRLKQEKQRLAELKRKQEEERLYLNALNSIADEHYCKQLLKFCLNSFKQFMQQGRLMLKDAENHCHRKMLSRAFSTWKLFWRLKVQERTEQAEEFYELCLLQRSFMGFKNIHMEYTRSYQVAVDFHDSSQLKNYFSRWQTYLLIEKCNMLEKEDAASQHYELGILRRYFYNWRRLPQVLFQEMEKEQRIRSWCNKVQELLPDFKPSYTFY